MRENPECDLVFTRLSVIDSEGRKLGPGEPRAKWFEAAWSFGKDDLPLAEWLGLANFAGTTSNFFARRAWLLAHPFRAYRYAHDYHALITCALEGRLGLLPEELLSYRVHATNTITTRPGLLIGEVLRMNLDLLRELAPRLEGDPDLRAAYGRYARAAWNNISSFPAGVFQCLLAFAVADAEPARLDGWLKRVEALPEAGRPTNRAVALGAALAEKYDALKEENAAWKRHARLLAALSTSGWVALGAFLGPAKRLARDDGKTAAEKYGTLAGRVRGSGWVRLGRLLRIKSAMAVIDLCQGPK